MATTSHDDQQQQQQQQNGGELELGVVLSDLSSGGGSSEEDDRRTNTNKELTVETRATTTTDVIVYDVDDDDDIIDDDIDDDDDSGTMQLLNSPNGSSGNDGTTTIRKEKQSLSWLTRTVVCILVVETAERFAFFANRVVLVLYLVRVLRFEESRAIALYAYSICLAYFSPLLGAYLADESWGRYTTILTFGCIYVVGLIIVTAAACMAGNTTAHIMDENDDDDAYAYTDNIDSSKNAWSLTFRRQLSFLGLALVCLGTGGIKPCVSAFGADQVIAAKRKKRKKKQAAAAADPSSPVSLDAKTMTTVSTATSSSSMDDDDDDEVEDAGVNRDDDKHDSYDDDDEDDDDVREYFAYFYFTINIGPVVCGLIMPYVCAAAGFGAAFGLCAALKLTAMCLFWSQRKQYARVDPTAADNGTASLSRTFYLCGYLIRQHLHERYPGLCSAPKSIFNDNNKHKTSSLFDNADAADYRDDNNDDDEFESLIDHTADDASSSPKKTSKDHHVDGVENGRHRDNVADLKQQLRDASQALRVLPIMCTFPVFWCLYDQQSSVWTLQATRMNLHQGWVQPDQMISVNPIEIALFVPLFNEIVYPMLENKCNIALPPLRRMAIGMALTSAGFFTSGLVETAIQRRELLQDDAQPPVCVFWQLIQITVVAVGEVFFVVTGLEFAYASSPAALKSFIMAVFLLTTAVGDFAGGSLYETVFVHMNRATVMHACAILMIFNLATFTRIGEWYQKQQQQQTASTTAPSSYRRNNDATIESLAFAEASAAAAAATTTTTNAKGSGKEEEEEEHQRSTITTTGMT